MSAVLPTIYSPEDDGLTGYDQLSCGCLRNSPILSDFYRSYVPEQQRNEFQVNASATGAGVMLM